MKMDESKTSCFPSFSEFSVSVVSDRKLVGAVRFELTTSWTRTTRASQATLRPEQKAQSAAWRRQLQSLFVFSAPKRLSDPRGLAESASGSCRLFPGQGNGKLLGRERKCGLSLLMIGTLLNASGILLGGIIGLTVARQIPMKTQLNLKILLGVVTVIVGLKMTLASLGGGFWQVMKQLAIVVLALTLGRITGRLLRLQRALNRVGRYAGEKFSQANPNQPQRLSEGFITCTILFCVGPIAILGAIQDGLEGRWQTLAIKAVMDGLATMGFVASFGWGPILAVIPVVAYQGTISLAARFLAPFLENHALMESVNATGGMLVFCIALIILEIRKIELADYLPSLVFAPLLAWLWK
jgi:uncharacterized protein